MDFRGKKYERGSNWSDPEVAELLQLWSDESVQIELESCLRNQHVFNRIAEVLHGKGIFRTGDQCREKIKKMKLEYRRIKENQKRTIRGGRTWKFYEVMDRVLTNRPSLSYSSGGGGGVMAHQLLPGAGYSDTYLHGLPTAAFGSSTSASYLFSHPPKPGDLLEIKSEDVNSEDGLLSSGGPAELLYHIGSGDEPDADSKSLGADIEDPGEAGRAEGVTHARLSPSGMSDQNMAGSSGTGMSVRDGGGGGEDRPRSHDRGGLKGPSFARQRKRRCVGRGTCGGGGSRRAVDKALLSFLTWQRAAEERLLSLEEARLEREAQAEERRQRLDERRAEQERQHELRLLSLFAGALTGVAGGRTEGRSATVVAPSPASTPPLPERLSTPAAPVSSTPSSCSVRGPDAPGYSIFLSRRGNRIRQHQGILQEGYTQYHADKYSQENPNGIINMGTSENKLCYDLLHQRLSQPDMAHLEPSLLQYPDWKGHPFLRGEVARFLTQYCRSVNPLKPENVVVMNGCGSLFSAIAAVLCDPEDAILIPTPFYGCITEDVHLYSSVRLVHAHLSAQPSGSANRPFHLSVDILESALLKAKKEGVNVRGVILVNPHNPLGEMYSSEEMTDFLEFAKRHELHVIVDEVYMLTVFDEAVTFHSVLSLDRLPDPQRTHVLWGLSKDFAMAGIRVGTLYSQNRDLVEALDQLGCFHGVPGSVQNQVARLLQDKGWINDEFLPTCRKRLRAAHDFLAEELKKMDVPYLNRPVGFFVWADFSKFLSEASFPAELELWRRFLRHRVVLSCGQAFSCSSPGWFRIVFSDEESRLQLGMQRIRQALEGLKESRSANDPGEAKQETSTKNEKDAKDSSTTRETSGPTGTEEPSTAATTDTLSLDGEELVVLDCQTSQSGVKLDSLIGELRQQIRSSDWLEKNTPELTSREDPELFEVFKDLLDRARK